MGLYLYWHHSYTLRVTSLKGRVEGWLSYTPGPATTTGLQGLPRSPGNPAPPCSHAQSPGPLAAPTPLPSVQSPALHTHSAGSHGPWASPWYRGGVFHPSLWPRHTGLVQRSADGCSGCIRLLTLANGSRAPVLG